MRSRNRNAVVSEISEYCPTYGWQGYDQVKIGRREFLVRDLPKHARIGSKIEVYLDIMDGNEFCPDMVVAYTV